MSDKEKVKNEYEELKEEAKKYTLSDIKSGDWFIRFINYVLKNYAKKVNAEFFREKYPNLPVDLIIDRRIAIAKKYAAIEGALSAGAYSTAVAATIGSVGGASPITIPAATISFVADLFYTTKLQLQLAYDISVLYGKIINIEDPEELYNLVKIAFGIKSGEILRSATGKTSPEVVRQGIKATIKGPVLAFLKELPLIGKYLLQKNIIKFSIPVISVAICAGLNYWTTGSIARTARQMYRDEAVIEKQAKTFSVLDVDTLLLLKTLWLVIMADNKTTSEETMLLNTLVQEFDLREDKKTIIDEFSSLMNVEKSDLLKQLNNIDSETASAIYDAACFTAAVDHDIHKKEHDLLREIASACRVTYSKEQLNNYIKAGIV